MAYREPQPYDDINAVILAADYALHQRLNALAAERRARGETDAESNRSGGSGWTRQLRSTRACAATKL